LGAIPNRTAPLFLAMFFIAVSNFPIFAPTRNIVSKS
jgi:hypothetical protein